MADLRQKLPDNAPGPFFVDSTCIDCETCCHMAPKVFFGGEEYAYVYQQPMTAVEQRQAFQALLSCPVGAIGSTGQTELLSEVRRDFPLHIEGPVYLNGFTSPKSYGSASYFIQHPNGNWMIDSPKYLPVLVDRFEALGGLKYIFLTHQDDVADAERYATYFGAQRIIHQADAAAQPNAEVILNGHESIAFQPEFRVIPTPGHTQGHMVLLFRNQFLFTGDHFSWDPVLKTLRASKDYCWYSWALQTESMEKLLSEAFEWVLPGHGYQVHLSQRQMTEELKHLVARMQE